jgi:hypothetical protein
MSSVFYYWHVLAGRGGKRGQWGSGKGPKSEVVALKYSLSATDAIINIISPVEK